MPSVREPDPAAGPPPDRGQTTAGQDPAAHHSTKRAPVSEGLDEATRRRVRVSPVNWLLVLPFLGVLLPWLYNKKSPELLDIPFFYWYQLAWIPISVVITLVVYRTTRGDR